MDGKPIRKQIPLSIHLEARVTIFKATLASEYLVVVSAIGPSQRDRDTHEIKEGEAYEKGEGESSKDSL
jgi:hypothetical protein